MTTEILTDEQMGLPGRQSQPSPMPRTKDAIVGDILTDEQMGLKPAAQQPQVRSPAGGILDDILGPHHKTQRSTTGVLDDILGPHQSASPAPREQNDAVVAAPQKQSWVFGMLDQLKAGATAGFDADAEAYLTSPSVTDVVKGTTSHAARRDRVKQRQARFLDDNPITGRIGYYGGLTASMAGIGPLLRAAGLARAATATEAVTGVNNLAKAADVSARTGISARLPATIGTLHEFGKAGLKGSALTAVGEAPGTLLQRLDHIYDPSDPEKTYGNAAAAYGLGAALGPAATWLGNRGGKAAAYMSELLDRARTEGGNVVNGATRTSARQITNDGVPDANTLFDQVMPSYGRGKNLIPRDQVIDVMERYGQHIAGGMDDLAARQQLVADMVQSGVKQSTAENRVRSIVQRYQQKNAVPVQLHELTALETAGEAPNTFGLYRFGANMPGDGTNRAAAVDFARQRQETQGQRLAGLFEKYIGDGDVAKAIQKNIDRIEASNDTYKPVLESFKNTPGAREALQRAIQGVHDETNAALSGRQDDIANAVFGQLNKFRNRVRQAGDEHYYQVTDPKTGGPMMMQMEDGSWHPRIGVKQNPSFMTEPAMDDLAGFIGQRGALADDINTAFQSGKGTLGSELKALRDRLNTAVRGLADDKSLPPEVSGVFNAWRTSNDARANAGALRDAWREGMSFPLSATKGLQLEKQATMMRKFASLPEERQKMFLMGLMGQMRAKIETPSSTSDISRFLRTDQGKKVVNTFFGDDAEAVQAMLSRAGIATRTHQANKGSQTAPMLETGRHINGLIELAANITNPLYYLRGAGNIAARQLERGRNDEMMRHLGANTDNPAELIAALRAIAAAQQMRQNSINSPLGPFASRGLAVQATHLSAPFVSDN